ncbi:MAG: hypothetical protein UZ21_OP11001000406 [Microgenomates bacterium OLB22]|nr:MAG: hypothetical protein UZ21_OP11001000406 [Microgenomates bacterium OLB22]
MWILVGLLVVIAFYGALYSMREFDEISKLEKHHKIKRSRGKIIILKDRIIHRKMKSY